MSTIEQLKEALDAAEAAYTAHQDAAPGRDASNAEYFAHVAITQALYTVYKAAADAYISAVHEQHTAARRVPTVGPALVTLPRYHGTLEWKGECGYITPDKTHGLISHFRVEERHVLGVRLAKRQTVTVEFSIALSFRNAILVTVDDNETSRAAFAAYLERRTMVSPTERKTLYQQQQEQDSALLKEYARKGDL